MDMMLNISMKKINDTFLIFIDVLIGTLTEGLESVRTPRCLLFLAEMLWVEFLWVGPVGGVPVEPFN